MSGEMKENMKEIIERKSPFCVISINTFGEYAVHDIQTNSTWNTNPYEDYVVVSDEMVLDIMETRGFCDIELNEEGTAVVSFTEREIPDIPELKPNPTEDELLWQAITELEIGQMEQQQAMTDLEIAQMEGGE